MVMPVEELRFMSMIGSAAVIGLLGLPFVLLSFAIPYALLRMQDARYDDHDPQIGLKAVLYFTFSLGVLIFLTGVNVLVYDLIREHSNMGFGRGAAGWRPEQRNGTALVVVGLAVCLGHLVLILAYTNDLSRPGTRRMFIGYRLAILAVTNLAAFTALIVTLFQENVKFEDLKFPLSVLAVWGVAWLVHLLLLRFAARAGKPVDVRDSLFRRDD
jgi:hypothetical protein